MLLKGNNIFLRALEPTDLNFLESIENDESLWDVSNTITPFSKYILQQYLENAHKDIFEAKQLRLVICTQNNKKEVGLIDLFDFDFKNKRAGIGIVIKAPQDRGKGYASEALTCLLKYSFNRLDLHQLYCNIASTNIESIRLFEKAGFIKIGTKKEWNYTNGKFTDEILYQKIAHVH